MHINIICFLVFVVLDPLLYAMTMNKFPNLILKTKKGWIPLGGIYIFIKYVMFKKSIEVSVKLVCIKDLYKSTHEKNVFEKDKNYSITSEDKEFYYVMSNELNEPMNFAKENHGTYYYFFDYFRIL